MKKLLSSFVILLAAFAAVAQNSFSYQSVIRADGKVLENKSISLRLSIMLDDSICYQEQHAVTTNAYGNVNVSVGEGEPLKGSFDAVPWESMRVMMRIEADVNGGADFTDLGSMQIMPVPYAMYAHRTTTVIQPAEASEEPIFEINDSNGNPMFAVYETGVKVFVEYDESEKAAKSRFAVAGRSAGKEADIDLLTIDENGTLVYVDDDNENKAAKSKFAVAGRPGRKGDQQNNLLAIDGSGSTIYVDNNENKAAKSKFAVAGRPGRKGASDTYFTIDENGTLVYVDDASANKAAKSKFAVAGRPGRKGGQQNNMLTIDGSGSTIYVDENGSKAAKSKFAVAGRPGRKGADSQSENKFTIDGDGSTIYVDFNSSDKAAKSKFAVAGRPGRKDASDNVMTIDGDQATFYIDIDNDDYNQSGKAAKSKFAVAGRPGKGDAEPYFIIDQFGSVIYIDEADSKAAKSRFAVAGRSGKGSDNYFTINRDSTRIYINDAPVADTTTGEIVVPSLASGFAVVGMVQKSDLLAVSKDSTVIKIDTYVAEEVQSVSGDVSKIIDDSKADKSYSSGALYLPLVKSEGGMTTRKKFLINYTYYHSDNGEYLYLKTQFKSGSDLINTVRNYYIVDGQVYGDNTYYVKYIEAGEPTIMPYSEVNPDFKEKLKLNLKSDNDLLVILESTMRDSAYSALAEDGRTAFYSPNGDHGKVMESERNIVAMMNDSARSLFSGNLNVFYSLLDTAVRVTQTVGMSYLTSLQWNYGTVSDFYNIDLSDYYYTLYDGDITDENIKITENYQDFTMRGDYQRRNLTEIETMFAGLKEGFDINAQSNNAAWGSVEKPATKVNYGDSINLVPVAAEGCIFLGWNDGCADSVRRIGITGPINYTANFQSATYYVSNKNSNDDFDGFSAQTPLASLSKALEKINDIGKADASFTINISGVLLNDTTVTIGVCAAKSLTIAGTNKQTDGFKIKEAATNTNVLCVANSTTKVTLKNLIITGGSQYGGNASALFVGGEDVNANVQLDNVLITDNSVDTEWGAPSGVGVYVGTGSMLTIGSGTEIKANKVGRNGRAVYNYGTIVMTGGTISDNINHDSGRSGYATDIGNCGEFTIDGDAVMGNVDLDIYSNKTITIGNNYNATADMVAMFTEPYGYYSPETQILTLPEGLSDVQKKAICDKFTVEPETDYYNEPISYWKVGISGKLEQVGHVVFITEKEREEWGFITYEDTVILEYNLDFNSNITIKPDAPDSDHLYLWYKSVNGQPDVNEFDFTNAKITSDESIIVLKGVLVPTECTVTFYKDYYDESPYHTTVVDMTQKSRKVQKPADPTMDGYGFINWYKFIEYDFKYGIVRLENNPFNFDQNITGDIMLIAKWERLPLYVSEKTPADVNAARGTEAHPYTTIAAACATMTSTTEEYTIVIDGKLTSPQSITGAVKAKKVTIMGKNGLSNGVPQDSIDLTGNTSGKSALYIVASNLNNSDGGVILKNLLITGATLSGNSDDSKGALHVGHIDSDGGNDIRVNLTLADGLLITGNKYADDAPEKQGSGVYTGNYYVDLNIMGSAKVAEDNDVYLITNDSHNHWAHLTYKSELTATPPVATITPGKYENQYLWVKRTTGTSYTTEYSKIAVTPQVEENIVYHWSVVVEGSNYGKLQRVTTATFNYNDGTNSIVGVPVDAEGKITPPDNHERDGYAFAGWFASTDGTLTNLSSDAFDFDAAISSDVLLVAKWTQTTFYVRPATDGGNDTNHSGTSPDDAFASLGTALNKIKIGNGDTETEYTIKVMGTTLDNITITNEWNSKAGRITFEGATKPVVGEDPQDEISGGSRGTVLSIQTSVPITIKNLKIKEGNDMLGGGIYVGAENADVTLDDGALITGNSASNDGGGGVDILQGKLTMLAGSKISGNSCPSASGGGVAIYENGTLDMKGGEISGNTVGYFGSGVYVQGTMIMSGSAVVTADNDVSLATERTITVGKLDEGENIVATITPQNYPSATSQVQVLSGEYVATEYSRFAVTPQGNSDNPSMPSEWEVNGEGNLIKISPVVVVTLTHSNIQEFTPDEEKSYEFIFDNTVTDSDLEYFCYNYDINRSSTLDMSQATLIANVNSLPAYLITVVLPPNVESISSDAFANIAFRGEATSVTIADGNAHYKTIDGVLFGEKETWGTGISNLLFYPPAKSGSTYEIPSFVTRIEDCGFMYNKNLVTINGLERIVYLQTFVFVECQKLQSANLSGVTMSGYNLFRNCQALESVTWGKESMLWAVFADCPKLEQIHFTSATPPSYLGAYGDYPVEFYGCNPNLKFYVPAGSKNAYLNATGDNGFYSSANACYDGNSYGYSGSLADRIIEEGASQTIPDWMISDGTGHYYVNLELPRGTMWATTNIGADNPQDFGDYFAWGETTPNKSNYSSSTYSYSGSAEALSATNDAAAIQWEGSWRMPTNEDAMELMVECYCLWTDNYGGTGVSGRIMYKAKSINDKGQTSGSQETYDLSDPHIFLPAAGYYEGTSHITYESGDELQRLLGDYWCSEMDGGSPLCLEFLADVQIRMTINEKYFGLPVRPVYRNGSGNGGGTGYIGTKAPGSELAVGDIVFNDGSAESYLNIAEEQKSAAIAVIFYTDGGSLGTKTLGVGLVQSSGKWGDDSNISDINDENNGANNLSWVKTYCDGDLNNNIHFPLFSWADKYGSTNNLTGNWYPPAINELSAIWQNITLINNAMNAIGKPELSGNYWSSTDYGEGNARYIDMSSGVSDDYMTTTYNFVAIRVFE